MKISRIFYITILLFIVSAIAFAEPDAVFEQITKTYTLKEDGTLIYDYSHKLRLLSYMSVNRAYGESFIVYDTLHQKLSVNRSVTTMADGQTVPSPENAFNPVLPQFAGSAPSYNHMREMIITHTGLERNSVIDLDYSITTRSGFLPGLMISETIGDKNPIDLFEIQVMVPKSHPASHELSESAGNDIYLWKFTNLKGMNPDEIKNTKLPQLLISSLGNWDTAFNHVFHQLENKGRLKNGTLKEIISSGSLHEKTELEKVLDLQKRISSQLANLKIPSEVNGFRFRKPEVVWKSAAGTPIEKVFLFKTVLENMDIPAEVVWVSDPNRFSRRVPILNSFGDVLVKVQLLNKKNIYLNVDQPVHQNAIYEHSGKTLVYSERGNIVFEDLPVFSSVENGSGLKGKITINSDEQMTGTLTVTLKGIANPYYQFLQKPGSGKTIINNPREIIKTRRVGKCHTV